MKKTYLLATAALFGLASPLTLAGQKFSQSYAIDDVTCVQAIRAVTIQLTQGDEPQLTAIADEDTLQRVSVEQKGDCLVLGLERGTWRFFRWSNDDGNVHFELQLSQPTFIQLTGASKAAVDDLDVAQLTLRLRGASSATLRSVAAEQVQVGLSGASRATLNALETELLAAKLSGASELRIDGESSASTLDVRLSGASRYFGESVSSVNAKAEASGASQASLSAQENLEVHASGASRVSYSGNPRISQHSSGGSTIQQKH